MAYRGKSRQNLCNCKDFHFWDFFPTVRKKSARQLFLDLISGTLHGSVLGKSPFDCPT